MTDIDTPDAVPEAHTEIRHHFEEQLQAVHDGLVRMASLVLENTNRVGEVMLDNRLDLVDAVFSTDGEIDALYTDLEERVFSVLALQQPVAKDLRFLVSATRMLYELERSGDLTVNCAKAARRSGGFTLSPRLRTTLSTLVTESTRVFGMGIDALADMDATAGSRIDQEDDLVDDTCGTFYKQLAQESEELGMASALELSRVGRYLERIADHAVNMSESVTYTVTGHWPHLVDPDTRHHT